MIRNPFTPENVEVIKEMVGLSATLHDAIATIELLAFELSVASSPSMVYYPSEMGEKWIEWVRNFERKVNENIASQAMKKSFVDQLNADITKHNSNTFTVEGKVHTIDSLDDIPNVYANDGTDLLNLLDSVVGKKVRVRIDVLD